MNGSKRPTSADMSAISTRLEQLEKDHEMLKRNYGDLLNNYAGLKAGNQQLWVLLNGLLKVLNMEPKDLDLIETAPHSLLEKLRMELKDLDLMTPSSSDSRAHEESGTSQQSTAAAPSEFTAPLPPPPSAAVVPPPPSAPGTNGESKASSKGSSTDQARGDLFAAIRNFGGANGFPKKQENGQEPANGSEDQAQPSNGGSASNQGSAKGQAQPQSGGGDLMAELGRTLKARNTLRSTGGPRTGAVETKGETSGAGDEVQASPPQAASHGSSATGAPKPPLGALKPTIKPKPKPKPKPIALAHALFNSTKPGADLSSNSAEPS